MLGTKRESGVAKIQSEYNKAVNAGMSKEQSFREQRVEDIKEVAQSLADCTSADSTDVYVQNSETQPSAFYLNRVGYR